MCSKEAFAGQAVRVRVNAQLIDAESDTHLWAERFSGETSDRFALQDEITSRIAVSLKIEMVTAEAGRRTEHPGALDYILHARAAALKPPSRHRNEEAIGLLERALALDPRSVEGLSYLANALVGRVLNTLSDSPTADIERARGLIEQALALSPHSVLAHHANGQVLRAQWRFEEAIPEYEAVLASDRNSAYAFFALGQCKLYTGHIEESIPLVERAIRLSPRDSQLGIWWQLIGEVHLLESRVDEAIVWLEKARNHTPAHPGPRVALASAYALNGEHERAATELAEAHRLAADDRLSSLAHMKTLSRWQVPRIRALFEATIAAGLRKAGMPEE
jgi:adenylate cyclase